MRIEHRNRHRLTAAQYTNSCLDLIVQITYKHLGTVDWFIGWTSVYTSYLKGLRGPAANLLISQCQCILLFLSHWHMRGNVAKFHNIFLSEVHIIYLFQPREGCSVCAANNLSSKELIGSYLDTAENQYLHLQSFIVPVISSCVYSCAWLSCQYVVCSVKDIEIPAGMLQVNIIVDMHVHIRNTFFTLNAYKSTNM